MADEKDNSGKTPEVPEKIKRHAPRPVLRLDGVGAGWPIRSIAWWKRSRMQTGLVMLGPRASTQTEGAA